MPIEEAYIYLRACDPVIQVVDENEMDDIILAAFASVTPMNCCNWIEQCGYKINTRFLTSS